VKLSGGEPTVRNDLPQLIELVAAEGLSVTVITNGIRIRDDVITALAQCGGKLKLSLHYGDSRNDLVVGTKCFTRIQLNAKRIVRAGIPFGLNSVVYRENLDAMESVASVARNWGARKVTYFPVVARGLASYNNYSIELGTAFRSLVVAKTAVIANLFSDIRVRCVDIANYDYWIIDNDGTVFISAGVESQDKVLYPNKDWIDHDLR
jgi:MoaA/NifB/PqqE/SkfB family radical SAM enzyme